MTPDTDRLPLAGLRVGISGAVPERELWGEVQDLDRLILIFNSQLSSLVMEYGGQVVHGSQPTFAPIIAEEARQYIEKRSEPLKLVASQLFGERPEVAIRCARIARAPLLLTPKVGEGDVSDKPTRDNSLTAMRLVLTQEVDVLIAIGGKIHSETNFNPGVIEELAQARWRDIPCFIIGAFGGAAGRLQDAVVKHFSEGNRLADEEVLNLARWSSRLDEQVGSLAVHLAKNREYFIKGRQESWRNLEQLHYSFLAEASGGSTTRVVDVDRGLVHYCSKKFGEVREALKDSETSKIGKLLELKLAG